MQSLGIEFDGSRDVLCSFMEQQRKAEKLMEDNLESVKNQADNVSRVLLDLDDVCGGMRAQAKSIGDNKIDMALQTISKKYDGSHMVGYPEYKVKGKSSLFRKLISKIKSMLKAHEHIPSYSPSLEECIDSIHDCLRYTIVFSNETYMKGVKDLEECLLEEGENQRSIAQFVKFKNYWENEESKTTYMGINAQVTLNQLEGIPNSKGFIFELQIHTPQSFEMKNGVGHLLYEAFRDPKISEGFMFGKHWTNVGEDPKDREYDRQLIIASKALWWTKEGGKIDGKPLQEGDVVCPGLKNAKNHKFTEEEYRYVPYKPLQEAASYLGNEKYRDKTTWLSVTQMPKGFGDITNI